MLADLDDKGIRGWDEYWSIALRRRWWILLSIFLVWGAVWGASWLLPASYQSEAMILVEQQKVPDQYVVPNVSASLQDRLQSISQQILSRTRLQATIDRFHLYRPSAGFAGLIKSGDPVELMRKDITIDLVRAPGHPEEFTAFKIRYSADSPQLAQQVNTELTSLFVNENVAAQQQLSEDTTTFLENQLTGARTKMEEQEAKVAAFKTRHLGDLPSQLESNVQILAGIQAQLQNTHQALDSAQQQKTYLESLLQQYQSARTGPDGGNRSMGSASGSDESAMTISGSPEKELKDLRLRLRDLQLRYTDNHPDVVSLKQKIAEAETLQKPAKGETNDPSGNRKATDVAGSPAAQDLLSGSSTSMMQLESQLKANQLEIRNYQQRETDLDSQVSAYRTRLNMTPETEQELTSISRGYEESKSNYNSLLQKQMQSQLATSLEQRQKGEQFRIVDPPSLPSKPSAPNHLKLSLAGLAMGIAVGFGLAAFLEFRDVRFRHEIDIENLVPVRVLVGIPHLSTQAELDARMKTRWLELGAATAMVALIALGNLYSLYRH
jgi:succinoglycan biosynthesis transport protein ExoP